MGALLRILLDIECVEDAPNASPTLSPGTATSSVESLAEGPVLSAAQGWLRETGYGAGTVLALGVAILGIAPAILSASGLGFWFSLPRVPIWAALLLPVVGAFALHHSQEAISAWAGEWWPLIGRVLDLEWAYRAVEGIMHLVGSVIWGGSRVVEGAGYMAWVALFCLVALLLVLAR